MKLAIGGGVRNCPSSERFSGSSFLDASPRRNSTLSRRASFVAMACAFTGVMYIFSYFSQGN